MRMAKTRSALRAMRASPETEKTPCDAGKFGQSRHSDSGIATEGSRRHEQRMRERPGFRTRNASCARTLRYERGRALKTWAAALPLLLCESRRCDPVDHAPTGAASLEDVCRSESCSGRVDKARTSLWLVPGPDDAAALSTVIGELATTNGTEAFAPHVTLLTGLPDDVGDLAEFETKLRGVLAGAMPLGTLQFGHLANSDIFFQCLVVGLQPSMPLHLLHSSVKRAFPPVKPPPRNASSYPVAFYPHLSLVCASQSYGPR